MRAIVSDSDVLKSIEPSQVAAYLQSSGWHQVTCVPNRVSSWTKSTFSEDQLKVYLPLDPEFEDYSRRMSEIMETLEKAENRSQLDILSELITTAPNITIQGLVTEVNEHNTDSKNGEITLIGIVVDQLRKIKIALHTNDYLLAVKAYQERLPLVVQGDLIKEDNNFVLKNPRNLTLQNL
jgi:hypothetical protein